MQVADQDRVAVVAGVAAVERVLRALAEHGGRGHVAAGLAEHAVVQQDARDGLAAGRGVQHLLQALVHHVAVALEGEHDGVGLHPLDAGRERRRAPVQRLQQVDVEVVREARVAADADDRDRARGPGRAPRSPRATARIAIGSPQPGHRWCVPRRGAPGVKSSTQVARGSAPAATIVGRIVAASGPSIMTRSRHRASRTARRMRSRRRSTSRSAGRCRSRSRRGSRPPMNSHRARARARRGARRRSSGPALIS